MPAIAARMVMPIFFFGGEGGENGVHKLVCIELLSYNAIPILATTSLAEPLLVLPFGCYIACATLR